MLAWVHQSKAVKREIFESWRVMGGWLEVSESLALKMRKKTGYVSLWIWRLESYVCLWRYVYMARPFFWLIYYIRWRYSKRYNHRRVVLCRIKLRICSSSILWQCGAPLAMMPYSLKEYVFSSKQRTCTCICIFTELRSRITDMAYKLFYEIKTQVLSRMPLVCSYSSLVLLYFLIASKQDHDDRSVKPPLALLDHAQILREVMQVYQSSFLGNEDEDEMDRILTGLRCHDYPCCDYVYF